ncbi:MAG: DUF4038 domain-containing protein [Kiritimatiellae bacterium]|nr:DUF4038 domain-containing protein [Kiritimatiellia bacterium]
MPDATGDRWPLRVGPNGHHLVDGAGRPFLLVGDTGWSLFAGCDRAAAEFYLDARRAQGFNTILCSLLPFTAYVQAPGRCLPDGRWPCGLEPFLDPAHPDLRALNDAYLDHGAELAALAAARDLCLCLSACWWGYQHGDYGRSFPGATYLDRLTLDDMRAYGARIGRRFREFKNIVYYPNGDSNAERPGDIEAARAIVAGIRTQAPEALFTFHPTLGVPNDERWHSSSEWFHDDAWLSFNAIQIKAQTKHGRHEPCFYQMVLADYRRQPAKPVLVMEPDYERPDSPPETEGFRIRSQACWSFLSGALGVVYGHDCVYGLGADHAFGRGKLPPGAWKRCLGDPGVRDFLRLVAWFRAAPWWQLEPDVEHRVVRAGVGTWGGADYAPVAVAREAGYALGYFPTTREVTVAGDALGGRGQHLAVSWFDPTDGSVLDAGTLPADGGPRRFAMPAANRRGGQDFLLGVRRSP